MTPNRQIVYTPTFILIETQNENGEEARYYISALYNGHTNNLSYFQAKTSVKLRRYTYYNNIIGDQPFPKVLLSLKK